MSRRRPTTATARRRWASIPTRCWATCSAWAMPSAGTARDGDDRLRPSRRARKKARRNSAGGWRRCRHRPRPMVADGAREDPRAVVDAAALGVLGAVIDPAQAREARRRRAHRAGLERDVEIAADQPRRAQPRGGRPDHQQLGVRGGSCRSSMRLRSRASRVPSGATSAAPTGTSPAAAAASRLAAPPPSAALPPPIAHARVERHREVAGLRRRRAELDLEPGDAARARGPARAGRTARARARGGRRPGAPRGSAAPRAAARDIGDLARHHSTGRPPAVRRSEPSSRNSMPSGSSSGRPSRWKTGRLPARARDLVPAGDRGGRGHPTQADRQPRRQPAPLRARAGAPAAAPIGGERRRRRGSVNDSTNQRSPQLEQRTLRPASPSEDGAIRNRVCRRGR